MTIISTRGESNTSERRHPPRLADGRLFLCMALLAAFCALLPPIASAQSLSKGDTSHDRIVFRSEYGDHGVENVCFTPDGKHILYISNGLAFMVSSQTGKQERTHRSIYASEAIAAIENFLGGYLALSPNGKLVLRACCWEEEGRIGIYRFGEEYPSVVLHNAGDLAVFSPDGRYIATENGGNVDATDRQHVKVTSAGPISIRWATSGKPIRKIAAPFQTVSALAYSADGKYLFVANDSGKAGAWSVRTGRKVFLFEGSVRADFCFVVSPNGRWICTGVPQGAKAAFASNPEGMLIWNAKNGRLVHKLTEKAWVTAAFSRDSRLFAAIDSSSAQIWDTSTWRSMLTLQDKVELPRLEYLAFSPDGKRLATGGDYLTEWNIADLAPGKPRP